MVTTLSRIVCCVAIFMTFTEYSRRDLDGLIVKGSAEQANDFMWVSGDSGVVLVHTGVVCCVSV